MRGAGKRRTQLFGCIHQRQQEHARKGSLLRQPDDENSASSPFFLTTQDDRRRPGRKTGQKPGGPKRPPGSALFLKKPGRHPMASGSSAPAGFTRHGTDAPDMRKTTRDALPHMDFILDSITKKIEWLNETSARRPFEEISSARPPHRHGEPSDCHDESPSPKHLLTGEPRLAAQAAFLRNIQGASWTRRKFWRT